MALLEEHLKNAPDDLTVRRAVIDQKRATGDKPALLAHLQSYIMTNPLDDAIHLMRSELLLDLANPTEALLAADCAVATATVAGSKASAHVAAARALAALDRIDEARSRLEEAIHIMPKHAAAEALRKELDSRASGDRR
jgi:hypothetical protein